jgi:thiaminase
VQQGEEDASLRVRESRWFRSFIRQTMHVLRGPQQFIIVLVSKSSPSLRMSVIATAIAGILTHAMPFSRSMIGGYEISVPLHARATDKG